TASDTVKFGMVKVQYIVDGEKVMLEECSPNALRTGKIEDNSLSLDEAGTKKITIDKIYNEYAETPLNFIYTEQGSTEKKNVTPDTTYYCVINNTQS
nr:hypothetical protein [Treponema sp.]